MKSSQLNNIKNASLNKMMMLATIILMDILVGTEFDLFVPSFPELQQHFALSPFWVEALLSVNFIGFAISLFFVGALADQFGRKPIILLGLVIFILGSIFCLWIPFYPLLLVGRLLQGVGIASPAILSFLIISDLYPIKKQQFLFAMLNGLMNASVAIAPVIGSYISLYFHWRGNFIALLLLGIFTLILTLLFIPTQKLPEIKESLSLKSYYLLFQSKPLLLLIITIVFAYAPYWIFVGVSPILFMEDLQVSLAHFGYYQGSLALAFALGSVGFGLLLHKYDQRKALYFSNFIFVFSLITIGVATLFDSTNALFITLAFLPFVIGQIIPSTILYPLSLNYIPTAKARVSALTQGTRLILSALSLQIAGFFYRGSFQNLGVILLVWILIAVILLFILMRNYPTLCQRETVTKMDQ